MKRANIRCTPWKHFLLRESAVKVESGSSRCLKTSCRFSGLCGKPLLRKWAELEITHVGKEDHWLGKAACNLLSHNDLLKCTTFRKSFPTGSNVDHFPWFFFLYFSITIEEHEYNFLGGFNAQENLWSLSLGYQKLFSGSSCLAWSEILLKLSKQIWDYI